MNKILNMALALMLLAGTAGQVQAQELSRSEQRKLDRELRKQQQAEQAEQMEALIGVMVEYRRFVLEAERLQSKQGSTVNVASNLNFVASDSVTAVIQIGSHQYVGSNGVGGITVQGTISNYQFTRNERSGVYNVSYNVRSPEGFFDVQMTVFTDGRADATVSSNWPGRVSYSGRLVPPAQSRVWKGTTRY
jgi:hypothetical protein